MNIGFLGLGKLGLPVALAIEDKGHNVCGTDISPITLKGIRTKTLHYKEEGAQELLNKSNIQIKNISDIVKDCDIIFVKHLTKKSTTELQEYLKKELILITNI